MFKLFRLYNQNRATFWIAIGTVIAVITIVRTLNNYAKEVKKAEDKSSSSNTTTYSAIYDNVNYSVITEEVIVEKEAYRNENIIEKFTNYCNVKDVENAYNMLSNDCKMNVYKTRQLFEQKYLNKYFKIKKEIKYQAWIKDDTKTVYRVEFKDDLLATGGGSSNILEDYFTLVNENGTYKLSINKYIEHVEINKNILKNNVRITVLSKDVYLENVLYNFKIENFSNENIGLNTGNINNSIMLVDANNLKYTAATWELLNTEMITRAKSVEYFTIKFLREFKPQVNEMIIEFNNVNFEKGTDKVIIDVEI